MKKRSLLFTLLACLFTIGQAKDYSDYRGEEGQYTSLQIINNGEIIYIGLQRDKQGGAFFFIQGKEKAFK